jgi:protein phosphatase PTC7
MAPAVRQPLAILDVFSARSAAGQLLRTAGKNRQAGRFLLKGGFQRRSFQTSIVRWSESSSSNGRNISYRVAASCSAKGRRINLEKNTHVFDPTTQDAIGVVLKNRGGKAQHQQQKRPGSGEDAFFASRVGATDTGAIAFGIADGVGGWAEHKVDPAEVSHGLCTYMAEHALAATEESLKPKELLQRGYDAVQADKSITAGGTTASVGVAQPDGSVELAK